MGFLFKGIHSNSYGALVKTRRPPTFSSPRIHRETVPGRNGSLKYYMGQQDVICELEISIKGSIEERQDKVESIREWLKGDGAFRADWMDETIAATVALIESSAFEDHYEVIRVSFEMGELAGSSENAYQIWLSKHSGTMSDFLSWLRGVI